MIYFTCFVHFLQCFLFMLSAVTNIAMSPNEEIVMVTLDNNQIYSLSLTNTDILKV